MAGRDHLWHHYLGLILLAVWTIFCSRTYGLINPALIFQEFMIPIGHTPVM